jgi:hypothetical protein
LIAALLENPAGLQADDSALRPVLRMC